jgi:hypothetical protein
VTVTCTLINDRSTDKEGSDDTVDGTVDAVLVFLGVLFQLFVFPGAGGANGYTCVDLVARFDSRRV